MGGYKDRTITLPFPALGKGCQVTIKNPALLPLQPSFRAPEGTDPVEYERLFLQYSKEQVGALVVEWTMWDVDTDELLALPSEDLSVLDRCPGIVLNRIAKESRDRTNP